MFAVVAVSCGADSSESGETTTSVQQASTTVTSAATTTTTTLPPIDPHQLMRWLDDFDEAFEVRLARSLVACMAGAGFPDIVTLHPAVEAAAEGEPVFTLGQFVALPPDGGFYGWLDQDEAEPTEIYGAANLTGPLSDEAFLAMFGAEDPDDESLYGGGCIGHSLASAFGDEDAVAALLDIIEEIGVEIATHPRMVEANAAWSACMADYGLDFASPDHVGLALFYQREDVASPHPAVVEFISGGEPAPDYAPPDLTDPAPSATEYAQIRADAESALTYSDWCQIEYIYPIVGDIELDVVTGFARDYVAIFYGAGYTQ